MEHVVTIKSVEPSRSLQNVSLTATVADLVGGSPDNRGDARLHDDQSGHGLQPDADRPADRRRSERKIVTVFRRS